MKNFSVTNWNQALEQVDFQNHSEEDINTQALKLSEQINTALDIIAPMKLFTIRPNYVQGLTEETKKIMKARDVEPNCAQQ